MRERIEVRVLAVEAYGSHAPFFTVAMYNGAGRHHAILGSFENPVDAMSHAAKVVRVLGPAAEPLSQRTKIARR